MSSPAASPSMRTLMWTLAPGILLGALDMNVLALALPRFAGAFDVPVASTVWLVTVYSLAYLIAMPIAGRLADMFGRKRAFIAGLALFTLGSLVCALSGLAGPSLALFLAGRAIQGAGAGGIVPVANALIGEHVPAERRGKALGLVGMCFGLASLAGPLLGGAVLHWLSWEWLFAINLPLGLAAIALALRQLPAGARSEAPRIDWAGGALLAVALGALMGGAEMVAENLKLLYSALHGPVLGVFALGAAAGLAFWAVEAKSRAPMLDLGLYRRPGLARAFLTAFLYGVGMLMAMVFTPMLLTERFDFTAVQAGLGLIPMALAVGMSSMMGGKRSDRHGPRPVLLVGLGLFATGLGALALGAVAWPLWALEAALVVVGLGFGFCQAPLNHAALQLVEPAQHGQATGALNTHRSIGGIVGATLGAVFLADSMSRIGTRMIAAVGDSLPPMCVIPRVVDPNHIAEMLALLPEEVRPRVQALASAIVSEQMALGLASMYAVGAGVLAVAWLLAWGLPRRAVPALESRVPTAEPQASDTPEPSAP